MESEEEIMEKIKDKRILLGCMRISGMDPKEREKLIGTALDRGINYFDHADIYGGGVSEEVFAHTVKEMGVKRDEMILQSKCGIREGRFDFSRDYILSSVDKILSRLGTDYLDVLLLHRPDALVEPQEVAEAFDRLEKEGKVLSFGVSNHNHYQIELLRKYVRQDILFNQLQFSIMHTGMIDAGLNVNLKVENSVDHDGGILDYCRLKDITIQAWSPFQYGFFEGVFLNNGKFPELNRAIKQIADKYGVTDTAVAIAWILRHPARMQAVIGTTNAGRVADIAAATDFTLTREEWYEIYRKAGNTLP
ncbi:MAG: aldo/keto reductase [Spirochaetales bacterium]|nr:aldo/keto reductase [Spirochaetales bacterium]